MKSAKVRIWEPRVKSPERKLKNGKKKPATYQVRWTVAGSECGRTMASKALADAFHSKLMVAARQGELFDTETGLPDSLLEEMGEAESKPQVPNCLELATDYIDMKWKGLSAKSRETTIYGLASVVAALVKDDVKAPSEFARRRALQGWYLEPAKRKPVDLDLEDAEPSEGEPKPSAMPAESVKALASLRKNSLPGPELADPTNLRAVLGSLATKMDGSVAANEYYKRRLGVFRNFIYYLVERGLLDGNPLKNLQWSPPKTAKVYDRRRVPNPKQVSELLTAVSYVGTYKRAGGRRYVAFFGCLYYGLQRPEEVIALNIDDCHLPEEKKKWGRLTLHKATPYAGRRWTEDGELHDDKALKQRAEGETRNVPIPPQLVRLLREHIAEFGVGDDGSIFRTERGKPVTPFAYERVWREARLLGLPPERVKSSLADVPYDLRAAGISLALRTTRDPARIAERAGNSIKILMERYAWALGEEDDAANKAIGEALGDDD